jgi:ribonuclease PH
MKLSKEEIQKIIREELRNVLNEFKAPEVDLDIQAQEMEDIELSIQPDYEAAQAAIIAGFAKPQR